MPAPKLQWLGPPGTIGAKIYLKPEDAFSDDVRPPFLRFIGVMEILGGFGLVLPGMLHIRTALTPLAAAGLSVIMIGAVVVTIQTMGLALAALPFVTGVLALFVAYGRWRLAPLG